MLRWLRRAAVTAAMIGLAGGVMWTTMPASHAQAPVGGYDESYFTGLRWRSVGPNRGGRSIAAEGSPSRPLEYYFGATGGGLWKTTDGGTTWEPIADKTLATSSVSAIAIAESNPDVVYVGMGETQLRGNVIQGDGVYKTTDGGKTWAHVGLRDTQTIARVRVHPKNADVVFVAALGHTYGPNEDRGVFRSKDGGATWQKVLSRSDRAGAVDISIDRTNPDVVYAGFWEVFRTPHSLSSGGPGSGLFKSTDGGDTWAELTKNPGLPQGVWGKVGVSVSAADPHRVFAMIEAHDGGLFLSDDGGATWALQTADRRLRQRAFYYTRVYADTKDRDTVYVMNVQFLKSTDAGKTWTTIRVPHGDNHDLWISPDDPLRMINANDGGANVSWNGGQSWTEQDYPTAQMYNVFTTKHVPYHVCGAQQDNTTACVPSNGDGSQWYAAAGCESGYIAPDPRNVDVTYGGCYGGSLTRLDRSTGQLRAVHVWPDNPMGHASRDIRERFQWTFPIVFSRQNPAVLYAASQHLWMTTTGGASWQRISPDLSRADPGTMGDSGGPITLDQTGVETYATIFTVAPSHHDADTIWVGSDDGVAHLTRDHGKSWTPITPPDLPPFTRISLIEESPHTPGTAYLAGNRYQRNDRAPYVYKTTNFGTTWTKIVNGLPGDDFPRVIREDTKRAGLLYLGTEHGVYVSFDAGAHWQSLRLNLPMTPVHGIVVEENDLVIGTHGRSFHVLDNIGVLRQLSADVTSRRFHLFEPAVAMRRLHASAPIDYYLAEAVDRVTIEILDAQGAVVRTFTGTADAERPAPPVGGFGPQPPRVTTSQGMNRFAWDMRSAGPTTFPGMILWAAAPRGPLAAPGRYEVRVTAGDETRTTTLTVRRDPRPSEVTDADVAEQFRFALEVRDRVSEANEAVMRIRHLKAQIADRMEKARHDRVSSDGQALTTRLTEIEGEIYQYRNQSSQDPLNYPIKLNNKIAALQGIVESAEARPTEQSYAVFKELSSRLAVELSKLEALVQREVAGFNRLVTGRRLEPVRHELPPAEPGPGVR